MKIQGQILFFWIEGTDSYCRFKCGLKDQIFIVDSRNRFFLWIEGTDSYCRFKGRFMLFEIGKQFDLVTVSDFRTEGQFLSIVRSNGLKQPDLLLPLFQQQPCPSTFPNQHLLIFPSYPFHLVKTSLEPPSSTYYRLQLPP